MERLTFDGRFCNLVLCQEPVCPRPDTGCRQKQVWDRLKAYEDTGLTPEEVLIQQGYVEGMKENLRIMYGDTSVQRLMELAKADKEGRCVVLTEDVYLAKTMREAAEAALKEREGGE